MAEQKKKAAGDGGAAEVDAAVAEAEAKGYIGETPDKTPNRNYTLRGVVEGAPTPETEPREDQGADRS
jgi:hypothetical protein